MIELISNKAKYYLYRNLHTGTFSLKYKGKVILHPKNLIMKNVCFNVSKLGQKKVRKEKRKNVHALISSFECNIFENKEELFEILKKEYIIREIYYNPYKYDNFVFKETEEIINESDLIFCFENKVFEIKKG